MTKRLRQAKILREERLPEAAGTFYCCVCFEDLREAQAATPPSATSEEPR